jgi:hypothetical protein
MAFVLPLHVLVCVPVIETMFKNDQKLLENDDQHVLELYADIENVSVANVMTCAVQVILYLLLPRIKNTTLSKLAQVPHNM